MLDIDKYDLDANPPTLTYAFEVFERSQLDKRGYGGIVTGKSTGKISARIATPFFQVDLKPAELDNPANVASLQATGRAAVRQWAESVQEGFATSWLYFKSVKIKGGKDITTTLVEVEIACDNDRLLPFTVKFEGAATTEQAKEATKLHLGQVATLLRHRQD